MNDFAKWRYALIAVVLVLGTIYALPNVFLPQPAVQISANHGNAVDEALQKKVKDALDADKIASKSIELGKENLLVQLNDSNAQNSAQAAISKALGEEYNVALNMASTVPGWLRAIGANSMPLGLDLQGGVHFLLEVDQKGALDRMQQHYRDDIAGALRDAKIQTNSTVNSTSNGIIATFKTEAERNTAAGIIGKQVNQPEKLGDQPPLELTDGPATADSFPLIAKVRESAALAASRNTTSSNLTTLRNRVNQLGVSEPLIQQQGANRIVVELAGVHDTAQAKKVLGATATLEWRAVDENATGPSNLGSPGAYEAAKTGNVPPESRLYYMKSLGPDGKPIPIILSKKIIAKGDDLVDARAAPDPQTGTPAVSIQITAKAGQKMLEFTQKAVGGHDRMGVVYIERIPTGTKIVDGKEEKTFKVDEKVISAAGINGVFSTRFITTGLGQKEANDLALLLRAGSLAAPVDIVEERVIGASLGQENIDKGFKAVLLGLLAVLIAAAIYYKLFGLIADVALVFNLVLLVAVLSLFQATLTMPGIAGIVLTLGMAIDANVLICERIREEQRNGATPLAAIKAGYEKAWATILDANVTHLLAAIALLFFGSGPIKGFGVTLLIGILTSMFTSVTVTHAIVNLVHGRRKLKVLSV